MAQQRQSSSTTLLVIRDGPSRMRLPSARSVRSRNLLCVHCEWRHVARRPLAGLLGLTGDAVGNIALAYIARSEADRLMLQRAIYEMDAWWLPGFLLLGGRTVNLDAIGYLQQRSKVRAHLRRGLCEADVPLERNHRAPCSHHTTNTQFFLAVLKQRGLSF